jgi:cobalt-zinc-cadmium efflux system outer membrane protein
MRASDRGCLRCARDVAARDDSFTGDTGLQKTRFTLLVLCIASAGCQSYRPRALDLTAHDDIWRSRSAASAEVAEFAQSLAERHGDPAVSFDASDGLSLHEAEAVALVFNADLRLARLRAGVAAAGAVHAGRWDDPVFGVDIERIMESVSDPWVIASTITFTVPISGRLGAAERLANVEHVAALREVAAEEWETVQQLRSAWVTWSSLRLRHELITALAGQLESITNTARKLSEAGEIDRPQATLFELERIGRLDELRQVEGQSREAQIELHTLLGLAPDAPVELQPVASFEAPEQSNDQLLIALKSSNLRLILRQAEYDAAERKLALEIREQYPDLAVGPGYSSDEGQSRALLGLSLPLPLFNANRQAIAEAEAQRELARAAYETEYERIVADVERLVTRLQTAATQRADLDQTLIPLADQQLADVRRLADLGELDPLLLLETIVRTHDAKLRLIQARLAEASAAIALRNLLGPPRSQSIEDILDTNEAKP